MRRGWHGLGWFLRRTADQERLGAFYRDVLGFPQIRQHGATPVFWLGETVVMGINSGGRPQPAYTDRSQCPTAPVFRVASLDRVVERLKTHDVPFINEAFVIPQGRLAYFWDPDNNVIGLQERLPIADFPEDLEARRRWEAGETTLTGAGPLPPDFQNLGWVVIRCTDLAKEVAFYRDTLQLETRAQFAHSVLFAMGDVVILEVAEGAAPQPIPNDRSESPTTVVFQVNDVDAAAAELKAEGVHFVNDPFDIGGGRVGYFVDPEGHLLGIQTRLASSERIEDQEFRRRVRAGARA